MAGGVGKAVVERKRELWLCFEIPFRRWVEMDEVRIRWPIEFWSVCESLGPGVVYSVGYSVLEYPPIYCDSEFEFAIVFKELKEKYQWD